jgi:hypothetical protein
MLFLMMYSDPMAIKPDNPKFMQRYLFTFFYYATSVKKPWDACAPAMEDESDSCKYTFIDNHLEDRKSTKNGLRWLSGAEECLWIGVDCDNSFLVRDIFLFHIDQIYSLYISMDYIAKIAPRTVSASD